ncbi:hypothetical protein ACIPSE_36245 [Streptomyces sp. NPDC090106]
MSFHKVAPVKKNNKPAPAQKQAARQQPAKKAAATSQRRPVGNKNC